MLSIANNERLTQVGPGTPMGTLMRRYWHPIAAAAELVERATLPVRLLGEDLVLYRDKSGTLGLIERLCAHRRVDLSYGIPEEHGLRCMYHGWMYDETGQCIEQPFEETVHPDGRFKEKVRIAGYPVEELNGLIFAYLGPAPAPLVPRWDLFVWDGVLRDVGRTVIPCNWLQCQENSLDPVHTEWLHAYYSNHMIDHDGREDMRAFRWRNHDKISFDLFEHGVIKRRTFKPKGNDPGTTESDPEWTSGHPVIFPNILRVGTSFEYRVPIDDTHTLHMVYSVYQMPAGVEAPTQESVPLFEIPLEESPGRFVVDYTLGQDMMAWATQGPVARRDLEKLGESDVGIILFRKLLGEQMELAAQGGDPINTFRDPTANEFLELFQEYRGGSQVSRANLWIRQGSKFSPVVPIADELYAAAE